MRIETIQIQIEKNGAFKKTDHTAELTAYLQDSGEECRIQKRPAVVICPGGGYEFCSFREGEPVALELLSKGYQTFVLRYSTAPDSFPTALLELAGAVAMVRLRAAEWNIIPEQVAVMGFSAGGHLAASLGVFWNQEFLSALVKRQVQFPAGDNFRRDETIFSESSLADISLLIRPDRLLLGYPVITSGEYAHRGSFDALLGELEGRRERSFLICCPWKSRWEATFPQSFCGIPSQIPPFRQKIRCSFCRPLKRQESARRPTCFQRDATAWLWPTRERTRKPPTEEGAMWKNAANPGQSWRKPFWNAGDGLDFPYIS